MDHAISVSIAILLFIGLMTSCITVPLSPGIYKTESDIKDLVDKNASRDDVIASLGKPMMQDESHISYLICRKGGGVGVFRAMTVFASFDYGFLLLGDGGQYTEYRSETECFKLVLEFDEQNRLIGYKLTELTDEEREKLLLSWAEQGNPEAQYQLYNRVHNRSERLTWLCRSAESGFPPAQAEVGRVYRWGVYGVEQDYKKAYQWYWLANQQVPENWEHELNNAKQVAISWGLQPPSEAEMNGLQAAQYECELLRDSTGDQNP